MRACYDLQFSPPTYDVTATVAHLEQRRLRKGEDGIDLTIIAGPNEGFRQDHLWPRSTAERAALMEAVVLPIFRLLPSIRSIDYRKEYQPEHSDLVGVFGYHSQIYGSHLMIEALRAGIRPLRVPGNPALHEKLVTITLREGAHWPARNSNLEAWGDFADWLENHGHRVVFVRDTLRAAERIEGWSTSPDASLDINARAFLYASSSMNFFVNNGPAWLSAFLDAPTCIFKMVEEFCKMSRASYFRRIHFPPGSQVPGVRICWMDDTLDNLIEGTRDLFEPERASA